MRLFDSLLLCLLAVAMVAEGRKGRHKSRGGKRCSCRSVMAQVESLVETRLHEFQLKLLSQDSNDAPSLPARTRLKLIEHSFHKLSTDVQDTKSKLEKHGSVLQHMKKYLYAQQKDIDSMSQKQEVLDIAFRNLTALIDSMEEMVLSMHRSDRATHEARVPTTKQTETYPKDCNDVYESGGLRYQGDYYIMLKPDNAAKPFKALCVNKNGSGWTVFQRRQDGSEDFYRRWKEYKEGFGSLTSEFWLGNDIIHLLTAKGDMMLRIEMEDWSGKLYHAEYNHFKISDEADHYRLHVSGYHGNAGDSLTPYWKGHNEQAFSTHDSDNDARYYDNCAKHYHGAWWFNNCFDAHLNGRFYKLGKHQNYFNRDGIQWNSIHMYSSLRYTSMMLKPIGDTVRNEV